MFIQFRHKNVHLRQNTEGRPWIPWSVSRKSTRLYGRKCIHHKYKSPAMKKTSTNFLVTEDLILILVILILLFSNGSLQEVYRASERKFETTPFIAFKETFVAFPLVGNVVVVGTNKLSLLPWWVSRDGMQKQMKGSENNSEPALVTRTWAVEAMALCEWSECLQTCWQLWQRY